MDPRRQNDVLKLVGALLTGVGLIGPVLTKPHASTLELVGDLMTTLPLALGPFLAGLGTRGRGLEYQDVADAKAAAKLSSRPPPVSSVAPTDPPTK